MANKNKRLELVKKLLRAIDDIPKYTAIIRINKEDLLMYNRPVQMKYLKEKFLVDITISDCLVYMEIKPGRNTHQRL